MSTETAHAEPATDQTRWLSDDEQRDWRALLLGNAVLLERLDRDLKNYGLSMSEYEVLVRLSEAPARTIRMAELADSVQHSRSRLTHTVARLEHDGLVRRRPCDDDRRGVNATLTDLGYETLVDAAPTHVASVRRALLDLVSPEDFAAVGRVFRAVVDAADCHRRPKSAG